MRLRIQANLMRDRLGKTGTFPGNQSILIIASNKRLTFYLDVKTVIQKCYILLYNIITNTVALRGIVPMFCLIVGFLVYFYFSCVILANYTRQTAIQRKGHDFKSLMTSIFKFEFYDNYSTFQNY